MGCVRLILPMPSHAEPDPSYVGRCRAGLEQAGHQVEVFAVGAPGGPRGDRTHAAEWRWIEANKAGLASAVMTGLCAAVTDDRADALLVLDPVQGYHPEDLSKLVEPVLQGATELIVARRVVTADHAGPWGRRLAATVVGMLTRPILGASDVYAGLVGLAPELAKRVTQSFEPVGSRFALDLLVRSSGKRVEVPVRAETPAVPVTLGLDDLRHLKRLADDRLGNASRLLQFCAVGASGMVVDLSTYALLQLVFSRTTLAGLHAPLVGGPLDLAAAGALAIAVALTWNFSLNRRLTFSYARHGSIVRQYLAYALSNALGIALSFWLRLSLPANVAFFHQHRLAAAVVGIVTATGISFSMARWVVFSRRAADRQPARAVSSAP